MDHILSLYEAGVSWIAQVDPTPPITPAPGTAQYQIPAWINTPKIFGLFVVLFSIVGAAVAVMVLGKHAGKGRVKEAANSGAVYLLALLMLTASIAGVLIGVGLSFVGWMA